CGGPVPRRAARWFLQKPPPPRGFWGCGGGGGRRFGGFGGGALPGWGGWLGSEGRVFHREPRIWEKMSGRVFFTLRRGGGEQGQQDSAAGARKRDGQRDVVLRDEYEPCAGNAGESEKGVAAARPAGGADFVVWSGVAYPSGDASGARSDAGLAVGKVLLRW